MKDNILDKTSGDGSGSAEQSTRRIPRTRSSTSTAESTGTSTSTSTATSTSASTATTSMRTTSAIAPTSNTPIPTPTNTKSTHTVCYCEHCDKSYTGRHARSILRRHYQEKHGIPLTAQPRRTRWDNSHDRPKDDDDRRRRMLESKRRWAANKRQRSRTLNEGGDSIIENTAENNRKNPTPTPTPPSLTPIKHTPSQSTLPPLTYPTRAPPSIPRFEIFREDGNDITPFKLPAITPYRQTTRVPTTENMMLSDTNTPPPTLPALFKEKNRNISDTVKTNKFDYLSSPAHSDLATKLGLAPTPKHMPFSPLNNPHTPRARYKDNDNDQDHDNDSPVKVRSKLPSLRELAGGGCGEKAGAMEMQGKLVRGKQRLGEPGPEFETAD
ncbi:hypothetical protein E3P91_00348 [Wallemia ichthyophaga]|nr:hypothetical protein E3P91_00348 [Wallemia ichthyophaga]